MNGARLSKEVTKRGRDAAGCEVFIDTQQSIVEVIYNEENKHLMLITKALIESKKERGGGDKIPEN